MTINLWAGLHLQKGYLALGQTIKPKPGMRGTSCSNNVTSRSSVRQKIAALPSPRHSSVAFGFVIEATSTNHHASQNRRFHVLLREHDYAVYQPTYSSYLSIHGCCRNTNRSIMTSLLVGGKRRRRCFLSVLTYLDPWGFDLGYW